MTPRTRAIYLNTPHNPIGVVLSEATLKQIADIAIRHNLYVVSDEAYEHVIFDGLKARQHRFTARDGRRHDHVLYVIQDVRHDRAASRYLASNDESCAIGSANCSASRRTEFLRSLNGAALPR